MNRERPKGVSDQLWEAFNLVADREGYGELTEDWLPWFECFREGWVAMAATL